MMVVKENIVYKLGSTNKKHLLDAFIPEGKGPFKILVFVHGGSWYNGRKEWYRQLGEHLAEKGIVALIMNYRLGHEATFEGMAEDVTGAVGWALENAEDLHGDRSEIFIAGHSAGGHLSALVTLNRRFFREAGIGHPLKGCILIDAFGLNMDYVMHNNQSFFVKELERVFTKDKELWKEAAPVRFLHPGAPPFLIFTGSRTYPYLTMDNEVFKMNLEENRIPFISKTIQGKNHVEMITSLQDPADPAYEDILQFMKESARLKPRPAHFQ